jgi:hypothetical protein
MRLWVRKTAIFGLEEVGKKYLAVFTPSYYRSFTPTSYTAGYVVQKCSSQSIRKLSIPGKPKKNPKSAGGSKAR